MLHTAGAGWRLLALLTLGLGPSLSVTEEDPDFSLCGRSFYRQTPPAGLFPGRGVLSPLCHRLPGGRASFATLHSPTCDTAVCSAVHLGPGWGEREGAEDGGKDEEEDETPPVGTPALLRWDGGESSDSPLHSWDSLVSELLRDSAVPRCSSAGGDLYVLTGVGGGARPGGEAADEACEGGRVFWSAACCAGPGGEGGFSVGLVRETEGGERVVSVKELEEAIGATELFPGGCGGTGEEKEGGIATLLGEALVRSVEKKSTDRTLDVNDEDLAEAAGSSTVAPSTSDTTVEEVNANIREQGDVEAVVMQGGGAASISSEPLRSTEDNETLASAESDTESGSTLVYIISSSITLLTAPLRPIASTITEIPGQVTYVLREDLGVLAALPGDTLYFFHLMASDLASGFGSAKDLLVGLGETCFSGLYSCTSPMAETLLSSCLTGVTGMGTLVGDGVGILGQIVDNAWAVTSFFGGRVWEQSEGYVGAVASEMGGQVKAVGGGLGKLVGHVGSGVGNVVRMAGGLVGGSVEMVVGAVYEAFGQDSG